MSASSRDTPPRTQRDKELGAYPFPTSGDTPTEDEMEIMTANIATPPPSSGDAPEPATPLLNAKKLARDAVQRLADSQPTDDAIEGMERLLGTPQESMFVVAADELERVIEITIEDAIYDAAAPPDVRSTNRPNYVVPEDERTRDIEQNRPLLPQAIRTALDDYARDCEAYGLNTPSNLLTTRAVLETRIMRAIRLAQNPPVHRELRGA